MQVVNGSNADYALVPEIVRYAVTKTLSLQDLPLLPGQILLADWSHYIDQIFCNLLIYLKGFALIAFDRHEKPIAVSITDTGPKSAKRETSDWNAEETLPNKIPWKVMGWLQLWLDVYSACNNSKLA